MKKITFLLIGIITLCFSFSAKAQCDYTLEMNDSWGDGWNGNTMDVLVNGTPVLDDVTFTGTDGSPAGEQMLMTFTVNDGDEVTTLWNGGGTYGTETSYRILDVNGIQVGVGSQTSITTPIIASCVVCTPPAASIDGVSNVDCGLGTFDFTIDVTSLGGAGSVLITNSIGMPDVTVTATGIASFVGFPTDTVFDLTLVDDEDTACDFVFNSLILYCPPANDDCSNAMSVVPSATGSPVWYTGTTNGTTPSGEVTDADISCANATSFGDGRDAWYSVEVPLSGEITITTQASAGSALDDTVMVVYAGSCGSLDASAEIACNDDATDLFSEVVLTAADGITPGQILLVRIHEYGSGANLEGDYEISATAADPTLSVASFESETFTYFPNPVNDKLSLRAQNTIQNVSVYNMLGQEVLRTAPNALESDIDMSELSNGAYIANVTINNTTKAIRIIKQ